MANTESQIDKLMSSREAFNSFVYTPIEEAIRIFRERQSNKELEAYVAKKLPAGAPLIMKDRLCSVLFRQVATPNYELRRFMSLIDGLEDFTPLFFEYTDDKFTDNNELKYHLGKMSFFHGRGKKGGEKITRMNVIDFQTSRGKPIKDVKTLWGQSLSEFHHDLLDEAFGKKVKEKLFFDASNWFANSGGHAKDYYRNFLTLFLRDGILFENFLIEGKEQGFTRDVFLPSLIEVINESGFKPLIVALTPTEIESNIFWFCHPADSVDGVHKRIKVV